MLKFLTTSIFNYIPMFWANTAKFYEYHRIYKSQLVIVSLSMNTHKIFNIAKYEKIYAYLY